MVACERRSGSPLSFLHHGGGAHPAYSWWKGNSSLKPVPNCGPKTPDSRWLEHLPTRPSDSTHSHLNLKVNPAVVWVLGAAGRLRGHLPADTRSLYSEEAAQKPSI